MKLHKTWNVRQSSQSAPSLRRRLASDAPAPVPQSGREKEGLFKGADAIAVVTGSANEDELYSKSASLQNWLLGYEFPDTCIVIGNRSPTVLTSAKKGAPPPRPAGSHYPLLPAHAPALWCLARSLARFFSCTAAPLARSAYPHGAYLTPCA